MGTVFFKKFPSGTRFLISRSMVLSSSENEEFDLEWTVDELQLGLLNVS